MKKIVQSWLKTLKMHKTLSHQLILLVVFVLLLLASYAYEWASQDSGERPLLRINLTSVSRLLFTPVGKETFSLEKTDKGNWALVSGNLRYPSADSEIQAFLSSLASLKGIEMQEQDKKTFNISAVPFLILYKGDQELESFFLGERNTLKREIYIQRKSDNQIFLSPDIFLSLVNRGFVTLVDNRVFPEVAGQELILMETKPLISGADLLPVGSIFTYTKTLTGWKSSRGGIPNSASFGSLNLLKATEVLPQIPAELTGKAEFEITLLWANNHQEKILLYQGMDDRLLASVDGSPYAYLLDPASLWQFYEKP